MPPIRWSPAASRSSSAPMSKSSRCTRIIASASGDRREDRDLVAGAYRVVEPHIVMVDRDPNDGAVLQRRRIIGAARAEPIEQPGHVADLRRQRQFLFGAADSRAQPGE